MARKTPVVSSCPCGQNRAYAACCGLYHQGGPAPSAEALMRSRYSAYTLGLEDYLLTTWHPDSRPEQLGLAEENPRPQWLGLEIRQAPPAQGDEATVEFVARYKLGGRAHRLHELSRFRREAGCWYYVDGEFPQA